MSIDAYVIHSQGPQNDEIRIKIHSLPTTIGRSHHPCKIKQFAPLGSSKALSRTHAMIFYCDDNDGTIETITPDAKENISNIDEEFNYRKSLNDTKKKDVAKLTAGSTTSTGRPSSHGGFAIECLGKNKIFVGKQRVEQGEIARLESGTPIKMASYCLYFLLPEGPEGKRTRSVSIPATLGAELHDSDDDGTTPPNKKQKRQYNRKAPLVQMEERPLEDLLKEFHHAIESDVFDRKHQMVSSGIMMYAVKTVAKDPVMIQKSQKEEGLSRTDIMDYIEKHETYSKWVKRIMNKMELKTYQANLSKALGKAEFKRVGTTGRHVKWLLPGVSNEPNVTQIEEQKAPETEQNMDHTMKDAPDPAFSSTEDPQPSSTTAADTNITTESNSKTNDIPASTQEESALKPENRESELEKSIVERSESNGAVAPINQCDQKMDDSEEKKSKNDTQMETNHRIEDGDDKSSKIDG